MSRAHRSAGALKVAVYPQLDSTAYLSMGRAGIDMASAPARSVTDMAMKVEGESVQAEEIIVTGSKSNRMSRYAKNARVQTGPGVPSWRWQENSLYWNSPVDVEQQTKLWIASPWMMSAWRVLMVGLLVALLVSFARLAMRIRRERTAVAGKNVAIIALTAVMLADPASVLMQPVASKRTT